jgi:hypothetical protein
MVTAIATTIANTNVSGFCAMVSLLAPEIDVAVVRT